MSVTLNLIQGPKKYMPRVKRGVIAHRKHKKILELAKGHVGVRSTLIRRAKESVLHAGKYAFAGRRQRRRDMRKLWITQLNNALDQEGISYSKFIHQLKQKNITLNRKSLAEIAVEDQTAFKQILSQVK